MGRQCTQDEYRNTDLNTQVYLLDKDLQLLPIGVPGDLYIVERGWLPVTGQCGADTREIPSRSFRPESEYITREILPNGWTMATWFL